jgi:signal transduction histidine kinase
MKSAFVRYVSHEIRTPINNVILGLKVLQTELHNASPSTSRETVRTELSSLSSASASSIFNAEMLELVEDMQVSSETAGDILTDLLLYEKLSGGLLSLEVSQEALWPFVLTTARPFRAQARSNNITLVCAKQAVPGVTALIDRYKLGQVVRNLVSNGLKFARPGGRVVINAEIVRPEVKLVGPENTARNNRAPLVRVKSILEGRQSRRVEEPKQGEAVTVRISVTDDGAGISAENQAQLFQAGTQFNSGKLQQGKGSGFGLWSKFLTALVLFTSF